MAFQIICHVVNHLNEMFHFYMIFQINFKINDTQLGLYLHNNNYN